MRQGADAARPVIDAYLDRLLGELNLDDRDMALVGFSQGSMMALHVALRRAKPCAAVIAYSGMLVGADTLGAEIKSRPPVLLVHGEADPIVGFPAMAAAEAALQANEVAVTVLARPGLGHGIDEAGIGAARAMLSEHLAAPR